MYLFSSTDVLKTTTYFLLHYLLFKESWLVDNFRLVSDWPMEAPVAPVCGGEESLSAAQKFRWTGPLSHRGGGNSSPEPWGRKWERLDRSTPVWGELWRLLFICQLPAPDQNRSRGRKHGVQPGGELGGTFTNERRGFGGRGRNPLHAVDQQWHIIIIISTVRHGLRTRGWPDLHRGLPAGGALRRLQRQEECGGQLGQLHGGVRFRCLPGPEQLRLRIPAGAAGETHQEAPDELPGPERWAYLGWQILRESPEASGGQRRRRK